MAILHQATLSPTKDELVATWLATQAWVGEVGELTLLGSYRFDDPAGEVGIETLLYAAGDRVLHLPLTYRAAPLAGVDPIATVSHSVLGTRFVHDGLADPVAVQALVTAALTGASQAELLVEQADGSTVTRPPAVVVRGSGSLPADQVPPVGELTRTRDDEVVQLTTAAGTVTVERVLGAAPAGGGETLLVSWAEGHGIAVRVAPTELTEAPETAGGA